jgi:hypothetical protein
MDNCSRHPFLVKGGFRREIITSTASQELPRAGRLQKEAWRGKPVAHVPVHGEQETMHRFSALLEKTRKEMPTRHQKFEL